MLRACIFMTTTGPGQKKRLSKESYCQDIVTILMPEGDYYKAERWETDA